MNNDKFLFKLSKDNKLGLNKNWKEFKLSKYHK